MHKVRTLGLLGTGVIGGGWAARAMHFGIDVIAADVKPEMEQWIREAVANAEPALARLTLAPLPPKGKLTSRPTCTRWRARPTSSRRTFPSSSSSSSACWRTSAAPRGADVIIASSTSGPDAVRPAARHEWRPSDSWWAIRSIRCTCCRWSNWSAAGRRRRPRIEAARAFYTYIGMHALHVRREVPGHLTDRLQEAMWREILHMVNDGVATTGELDESIIYGPGTALGGDGHEPDLPPGRRRDRHAPHAASSSVPA